MQMRTALGAKLRFLADERHCLPEFLKEKLPNAVAAELIHTYFDLFSEQRCRVTDHPQGYFANHLSRIHNKTQADSPRE